MKSLRELGLRDTSVNLGDLRRFGLQRQLHKLDIDHVWLNFGSIQIYCGEPLNTYPYEYVELDGPGWNDEKVEKLEELKHLQYIQLLGTSCGIGLFDKLPRFSDLRAIRLCRQSIPVGGIHKIASCTQVYELELQECALTHAELRQIAGMENLEILNLSDITCDDWIVTELANLKNLQWLHIDRCSVPSEFFGHLPQSITTLKVDLPDLDDQACKGVLGMTNLRRLLLGSTKISREMFRKLDAKGVDVSQ